MAIADAVAGLPSVVLDDVRVGRLMAEHLAERGHRYILYRSAWHPRTSTVRRTDAFLKRAAEIGLVVYVPAPTKPPGELSEEEVALLTTPASARPTAVACYSEEVLVPVLHTAPRMGLRVPDDLALIASGAGSMDSATRLRPTVVLTPWSQVAQRSVDILIDIIAGKEVSAETVLPVELVVGDTS